MDRTWRDARCPDCRQVPRLDTNNIGRCGCNGKSYKYDISVAGAEDERAELARNGFTDATDITGNVYYVGPWGHIVELFADATWYSDKAPEGITLDEYLKQLAKNKASLSTKPLVSPPPSQDGTDYSSE